MHKVLIISVLLASGFAQAESHILITATTMIDGSGKPAYGPVDIEIAGNKIRRISRQTEKSKLAKHQFPGARIIDGSGKFVTPGLINAHTHLPSVPGSLARMDSREEIKSQQLQQLKIYIAAGVTTVLDAATPEKFFETIEEFKKQATIPRVLMLAPFITPTAGYMASDESRGFIFKELCAPIATAKDVRDRFSKAAPLHPLGAKVVDEYGFGPFNVWPPLTDELRDEIVQQARNFTSPIFVHSERIKEFENALKLKPYAFMHGGFFDETLPDELLGKINASEAYVVSTLAIYKMLGLMWDREIFNDPWFKMLVPQNQIETALDPKITENVIETMAAQNRPKWCPESVARLFAHMFTNRRSMEKGQASSSAAVAKMFRAGVPIVTGADEGNWPLLTTMFHGVGSIFEMELLQEAGIPPLAVIRAATSRAAEMLKLNDVGVLAEEKIADLLILSSDPQTDRQAFRKIEYVVKDGIAKTPPEWLSPK